MNDQEKLKNYQFACGELKKELAMAIQSIKNTPMTLTGLKDQRQATFDEKIKQPLQKALNDYSDKVSQLSVHFGYKDQAIHDGERIVRGTYQ